MRFSQFNCSTFQTCYTSLAPPAAPPDKTHHALPAALRLGLRISLRLAVARDALLHLLVDLPHGEAAGAIELVRVGFAGVGFVGHTPNLLRVGALRSEMLRCLQA
jgi:hypothetical protein